FLALADAANATYLVSKDKAVLKLKRRMAKYCDVAVLPPKQFVALVQLETAPLVQA
ncbi:PIN family protein, partial [Pandoraea nosoerga]|nr:PIN family protein [Pandoraea nosoerga]